MQKWQGPKLQTPSDSFKRDNCNTIQYRTLKSAPTKLKNWQDMIVGKECIITQHAKFIIVSLRSAKMTKQLQSQSWWNTPVSFYICQNISHSKMILLWKYYTKFQWQHIGKPETAARHIVADRSINCTARVNLWYSLQETKSTDFEIFSRPSW
jgi:hypothetical protein